MYYRRGSVIAMAIKSSSGKGREYIQLVAVQMHWSLTDYLSTSSFEDKIDRLMQQAAAELDPSLPALVVFPEDVGLLTVFNGVNPRIARAATTAEAVDRMVKGNFPSVARHRFQSRVSWIRAALLSRSNRMGTTYLKTFSAAAKKHGVYLVAGSAPLPDYGIASGPLPAKLRKRGTDVFNVSYFFGPDGHVIGSQRKVNFIPMETAGGLDLVAGRLDELQVFETPVGNIGIAICLDGFVPEVIETLAGKGANILVQPSANPGPWTAEQQIDWLRGAWDASVGSKKFAYAVNPMMTGTVFDLGFYGQSSIVVRDPEAVRAGNHNALDDQAPIGYRATGARIGFLTVAQGCDTEEVLVAKVPRP